MTPAIVTLWTKPNCVQCNAVKRYLKAAGIPYEERDLTLEENVTDLAYFKSLGYQSAPITEFGPIAVAGFNPGELDRIVTAFRETAA